MARHISRSNSIPSLIISFWLLLPFHLNSAPSVSQLSVEEKVGQLLMVHFHGREANEDAAFLIQKLHIGGIIYYNWANGLTDPEQVRKLSDGLQQLARNTNHSLPLLIAADQEGGLVNRLNNGFTVFPSNYALGMTGEYSWGRKAAQIMGQELKSVGISLNLAPVIDVCTNPANPVIGIRSFSSDPEKVAAWGDYALQGYREAGVAAALKHFPGHGDVSVDSHEGLPLILKSRKELDGVELLPFRKLAPQADVILTAHLMVPALDPDNCATLSKTIVEDLLRNEMHFNGVVMTDSFAMDGILGQSYSIEEAVLKSLEAGHDVILLGGKQLLAAQNGLEFSMEDVKEIHKFLVDAVKAGRLPEKRVDEAVGRLLALKEKIGLFEDPKQPTEISTHEGATLARQIARKALRLIKGEFLLPLSLQPETFLIVAPDCLKDQINTTSWKFFEKQGKIMYFEGLNPDAATIRKIKEEASRSSNCLFLAYHTWKFAGQQELFRQLSANSPCTVALAVRDPYDGDFLMSADLLLCTYSPVSCSLQAAFDYLTTPE